MGSSSSKAISRTASSATIRKYPNRPSTVPPPSGRQDIGRDSAPPAPAPAASSAPIQPSTEQQGPTVHTHAQAAETRTSAIDADAQDPHLLASLRQLGPVTPYPTFSPSSTASSSSSLQQQQQQQSTAAATLRANNPALNMLAARARIEAAVEAEKAEQGVRGFAGRTYMDVGMLKRVLEMRDLRGLGEREIERTLGLREGMVGRLGRRGVVEVA